MLLSPAPPLGELPSQVSGAARAGSARTSDAMVKERIGRDFIGGFLVSGFWLHVCAWRSNSNRATALASSAPVLGSGMT
jgi:hypothetical protein